MRTLRALLIRLAGFFARRQKFAEEIESHLEMHIEDNLRAGMSPLGSAPRRGVEVWRHRGGAAAALVAAARRASIR